MHLTTDTVSRRRVIQFAGIAAAGAMLPRIARAGEHAAVMAQPPAKPTTPAAAPSAQPPGFYRFKIGGLDAVVLSDGFAKIAPVYPMFAAEASSKEEVDRTLEMYFQPTDAVNVEFNVLCVKIGPEVILIDSGSGAGSKGTTGKLAANLAAAGIRPEQVTAVVISHAHGDHISGLVDGDKPTYPNARI
ncbi:MAG: MBL fold metallo-hydrolase, partial [Phycisphaerales bacterium]